MTCGYQNSAGTDLDNLFYINNGNAGALGFQISNGQDLGNRYTNGSTLGYSVGYKNSAGTDLGYLRGNITIPTLSSNTLTNTVSSTTTFNSCLSCSYSEDYIHVYSSGCHTGRIVKGYLALGLNMSQSATFGVVVKISMYNNHPRDREDCAIKWAAATTSSPNGDLTDYDDCLKTHPDPKVSGGYYYSWRPGETEQMPVYSGSLSGSSLGINLAYAFAMIGYNNDSMRAAHLGSSACYFKVYVTISNSAGSTSATYTVPMYPV